MERGKYGVVTFHSTSHAIQAEKICRQAGLEVKLIPTPRRLSSDCGISLRFAAADQEALLSLLATKVEIRDSALLN